MFFVWLLLLLLVAFYVAFIWSMSAEPLKRAKKSKEYEYYRVIRPQTDFYMECYVEGIKELFSCFT